MSHSGPFPTCGAETIVGRFRREADMYEPSALTFPVENEPKSGPDASAQSVGRVA